jgi:glutaminase
VIEEGDTRAEFAMESISQVSSMALVMEETGGKAFRAKIGTDPTGMAFNSVMALEMHAGKPLSALVNAGAIAAVSLVPAAGAEERWRKILAAQSAFAGRQLALSEDINSSEQAANFHNRTIAWLLYGAGSIYCDPMQACDACTCQCSALITVTDLAAMGATLPAGGVHPLTRARVVSTGNVPRILAEMTMEGLYQSSGDWAYTVACPARAASAGACSPSRRAAGHRRLLAAARPVRQQPPRAARRHPGRRELELNLCRRPGRDGAGRRVTSRPPRRPLRARRENARLCRGAGC